MFVMQLVCPLNLQCAIIVCVFCTLAAGKDMDAKQWSAVWTFIFYGLYHY
jgi:hypothetical protein